jgi:hypothetical protein
MILERLARTLEGPSRGPFFMAQALRYLTSPHGARCPVDIQLEGENMSRKIISFNTGRWYTEAGQRIAATQLDDGRVVFVDIDRGIRYATAAPCELTQRAVMQAYDYNLTEHPSFDLFGGCWEAREAAIAELEAAARAVQGVRS